MKHSQATPVLCPKRHAMSSTSSTVCTRFVLLTDPVDLLLPKRLPTELGLLCCLDTEPSWEVLKSGNDRLIAAPPPSAEPSSAELIGRWMRALDGLLLAVLSSVLPAEFACSANGPRAKPIA